MTRPGLGSQQLSGRTWQLAILTALLLFAVWLRMRYLVDFVEWPDEIRTLWRTQGSFAMLLARNPPDWPVTYGALTWAWVRLAGGALEASRVLSVFFGALGVALTYRATRALLRYVRAPQVDAPAVVAATVYAVLGYVIFAGVDVRAYGLLLALGPLAFWLALRWLRRPNWRRTLLAAVSLAALVYVSYTGIIFIGLATLFVLVMRPRLFPRWLLTGALAVILLLPLASAFLADAARRVDVMPQPVPPFFQAMAEIYRDFGGSWAFVVMLSAAALLALALAARERSYRKPVVVLALWLLLPAAVYFAVNNEEFLKPRYNWPVVTGITLLIALACARLPRAATFAVAGAFVILAAVPVDYQRYRLAETTAPPYRQVFSWLAQRLRPGDVMVIDPDCTCGPRFGWDTFVRQYFPSGYLPVVDDPGAAPRVWYLSNTGWTHDEALLGRVRQGRAEGEFVGPWFFLLRLYEGAPLPDGIPFGDQIAFNGADVAGDDTILAQGDRLDVRLWWSARRKPDADYSISLAVLDPDGQVVAQADGPARGQNTPEQMTAWEPGAVYADRRTIDLPQRLEDGDYQLVITVYQWWDGVRLEPGDDPGYPRTGSGGTYLVVRKLRVTS